MMWICECRDTLARLCVILETRAGHQVSSSTTLCLCLEVGFSLDLAPVILASLAAQ